MRAKSFQFALIALIPEIFAVTFPVYKSKSRLFVKRDLQDYLLLNEDGQCNANPEDDVFSRFNAVFFGDYLVEHNNGVTGGPVAVGGNMTLINEDRYQVNWGGEPDCSNLQTSFDGYGLVVGGSAAIINNVRVSGAVFLPADGNLAEVTQLVGTCPVTNSMGTGLFDFNAVQSDVVSTSMQLALYPPSLYLDSNDELNTVGPKTNGYDVITFNTCNAGNCPLWPGMMSDPSSIFFSTSHIWQGVQGQPWPSKLIVNVPVDVGEELDIHGEFPTMGMNFCGTIFNFYPSSADGAYSSGDFTFNLGTYFYGLTLMPEATIIGGYGGFVGQIFAKNFFPQGLFGLQLASYFQCDYFNACATETVTPIATATVTTNVATAAVTTSATITTTHSDTVTLTTTTTAGMITQTITKDDIVLTTTVIYPDNPYDHKHHHHETIKKYDCEHGNHNHGPVLFCEYDGHHHHKLEEEKKHNDDYRRKDDDDYYDDRVGW